MNDFPTDVTIYVNRQNEHPDDGDTEKNKRVIDHNNIRSTSSMSDNDSVMNK